MGKPFPVPVRRSACKQACPLSVRRRACFSTSLTLSQPPCRNTRQRAYCGCCDFTRVSQPRGKSNPLDKAVLCSWGRAFPCNPNITFVFKSNIEHENNRPLIFGAMGGNMNAPINWKFRQADLLHHIRKAKAVKPSLIYYQLEFEEVIR